MADTSTDKPAPGTSVTRATNEPLFQSPEISLGPWTSYGLVHDPKHLAFVLGRYKFVAKMLQGRERVIGAGHTPQEYAATGLVFDAPAVRKERLIESVRVIRRLVDGETVDFHGEHVRVEGAEVGRSLQDHLPILLGGNGARLLGATGELADIVGLQGLGRTLPDGHQHDVRWTTDHLTAQVEQVHAGAGARVDDIEFNALVQVFNVTDDRNAGLEDACEFVGDLSMADAAVIPYLMIGTVDEIVAHVHRCRDRWGITYFVVRTLDDFAPVLEAFR